MKTITTFVLLVLTLFVCAQDVNRKISDEKSTDQILIGVCNKQGLMQVPYADWFVSGFNSYTPDARVMAQLKEYTGQLKVNLVLGTWCSDSQREVPRFFKIAENCGLSSEQIKVLCVDSKKTGGDVDISGLKIEKVPTFIFFKNDKEIGRIVESPEVNIETDLLKIIQKQ